MLAEDHVNIVVMTRNGTAVKLYENASLRDTVTWPDAMNWNGIGTDQTGGVSYDWHAKGYAFTIALVAEAYPQWKLDEIQAAAVAAIGIT